MIECQRSEEEHEMRFATFPFYEKLRNREKFMLRGGIGECSGRRGAGHTGTW